MHSSFSIRKANNQCISGYDIYPLTTTAATLKNEDEHFSVLCSTKNIFTVFHHIPIVSKESRAVEKNDLINDPSIHRLHPKLIEWY